MIFKSIDIHKFTSTSPTQRADMLTIGQQGDAFKIKLFICMGA